MSLWKFIGKVALLDYILKLFSNQQSQNTFSSNPKSDCRYSGHDLNDYADIYHAPYNSYDHDDMAELNRPLCNDYYDNCDDFNCSDNFNDFNDSSSDW